MNSRQIEQIAVNAVKDIFLQSEIFNPCIPDNDREPIWDGFIYIQTANGSVKLGIGQHVNFGGWREMHESS